MRKFMGLKQPCYSNLYTHTIINQCKMTHCQSKTSHFTYKNKLIVPTQCNTSIYVKKKTLDTHIYLYLEANILTSAVCCIFAN